MFVYVLKSLKDGKNYIGCTKDIEKRMQRHNLGLVNSTRYRKPVKLVYSEELIDYREARKREIKIKKRKGGIQFKELLKSAGVVQQ